MRDSCHAPHIFKAWRQPMHGDGRAIAGKPLGQLLIFRRAGSGYLTGCELDLHGQA